MVDPKDLNSFHLLLIDDDEDEYVLISDLLKSIPHTKFKLDWISSYEDAKNISEKKTDSIHDVCLLDYRLGSHTGLDLLKQMMADGYRVPVILLTGYSDANVDREAVKSGATDYLAKADLNPSLLDRAIRYAVYRTQLQKQMISHERMASIGLLASGLAHDIGTPLGVIRGRAEYLLSQLEKNAPAKNNAEIIISQIDRISETIRSLLNIARGDQSTNLESVNFNKILDDVLALMAHEFRVHNIVIKNQLKEQNAVQINAEAGKLHQVLLNLLMNSVHAIAAAKKNGAQREFSINISCGDIGPQWEFYIQDNGCGIPKENLKQIFRPFFSTKEHGMGTGLGLSTAQWILQSWGGSIDLTSQDGTGTVIKLRALKK